MTQDPQNRPPATNSLQVVDAPPPVESAGCEPRGPVESSFSFDYNPQVYGQLLGLFARKDLMSWPRGDQPK